MVLEGLQETEELQEVRECLGWKDLREPQELMDLLVLQVLLGLLVPLEIEEVLVCLVPLVLLVHVASLEHRENGEILANQERKALLVLLEYRVHLDQLVVGDREVRKDLLVKWVFLVLLADLETKDLQELQE